MDPNECQSLISQVSEAMKLRQPPLLDWRVDRRFTDRSCRVLRRAEDSLASSGGGTLDLVHLLTALLDEDARLRQGMLPEALAGPDGRGNGEMLVSPERDPRVEIGSAARMALMNAYSGARAQGTLIDLHHLLLGLLSVAAQDPGASLGRIDSLGLDLETVIRRLRAAVYGDPDDLA